MFHDVGNKSTTRKDPRRSVRANAHSRVPTPENSCTKKAHEKKISGGFDLSNISVHSPDPVEIQIEPETSQETDINEDCIETENLKIDKNFITNLKDETNFIPLSSISCIDEEYYYFFHGTFLKNLRGIAKVGLDPKEGGGNKGAKQYENIKSSDACGVMKYATDPNIAMIYSEQPTEMKPPEIGVLLQARVKINTVKKDFDNRSDKNSSTSFWRKERGGENERNILGIKPNRLALNEEGGKGQHDPIRAVETNTLVPPEDIKLVGIHLPPKTSMSSKEIPEELYDF